MFYYKPHMKAQTRKVDERRTLKILNYRLGLSR